uniref:Uncharacterized protein n=1 Tax=Meloidogyne hapla TaxID=6305 RepID=A0A1I8BWE7_MELHA
MLFNSNKLQLIFIIIFFSFIICNEIEGCIYQYNPPKYTWKCDPARNAYDCCTGLKCTAATNWECKPYTAAFVVDLINSKKIGIEDSCDEGVLHNGVICLTFNMPGAGA